MLILILTNGQFLQNVVFSFEKGSNGQNQPSSDSYQPIKKSPPSKAPHSSSTGSILNTPHSPSTP